MPVKVDITPPPPANSKQPGVTKSLLYNGSKFQGHQKSKGNSYEVEVVLQVSNKNKASTQYCDALRLLCFTKIVQLQCCLKFSYTTNVVAKFLILTHNIALQQFCKFNSYESVK